MNNKKCRSLPLTAPALQMPIIGIGLEEHVIFDDFDLINMLPNESQISITHDPTLFYLKEIGEYRLDAMDRSGTWIQVISWVADGANKLTGQQAIQFAKAVNDKIFDAIQKSPNSNRFYGFAHLPTSEPEASAEELERCVKNYGFVGAMISGIYQNRFLDEEFFSPILSKCEELNCPIYLHPTPPPPEVKKAYYYETPYLNAEKLDILARPGWGWHSQIGLHILRMCYAETFSRHPNLKIIIGHNGEMLPMMMHRQDEFNLGLKEPVSCTLRKHVYVTLSGIFSLVPLKACIETFGIDHICWSTDYPYVIEGILYGKDFIRSMRDIMTDNDLDKILYKNAESLLKINLIIS